MTIYTDTNKLITYKPRTYPNIEGGEARYLSDELSRLSDALNKAVAVMKLIETRLNANGLT